MSMIMCDVCGEIRDSDYVEFFEDERGDVCIYCNEMEDEEYDTSI